MASGSAHFTIRRRGVEVCRRRVGRPEVADMLLAAVNVRASPGLKTRSQLLEAAAFTDVVVERVSNGTTGFWVGTASARVSCGSRVTGTVDTGVRTAAITSSWAPTRWASNRRVPERVMGETPTASRP